MSIAQRIVDRVRDRILKADISLLNGINCSDDVMSTMAAEHAARCETLAKAIDPSLGRPLLVMAAKALLDAAKQIDEATTMQPELVTHA